MSGGKKKSIRENLHSGSGNPMPQQFLDSLDKISALADPASLIQSLEGPSPVSVRFNPYKISSKPEGEQIPWNRYGMYLAERPRFILDPLWHAGAYYVQEAGSMFVEHMMRQLVAETDGIRILDLCAAPGGKTTMLAAAAGLDSLVVANEPIRQRAHILADNVARWGMGNVLVTNNDPAAFTQLKNYFDLIVVDAPCSGEGMFRKDSESRAQWSPDNIALCSARQRRIVSEVVGSLKPGGILIYSTCTFNESENEQIVDLLINEHELTGEKIGTLPEWNITETQTSEGGYGYRFFPHLTKSEGFFAAALRKPSDGRRANLPRNVRTPLSLVDRNTARSISQWFIQPQYMKFATTGKNVYGYYERFYEDIKLLAGLLNPLYSGVIAGQIFGSQLRPAHELALFHDLRRDTLQTAELDLQTALTYLRKGEIDALFFAEGINLVTFEGFALGWLKRIGTRANNMLPKEQRILNG